MAIVCPACRKANQSGATCQRCGADLQRLHEIDCAALATRRAAMLKLTKGDTTAALALAATAWRWRHVPEAAQIAFVAAAAAGDTTTALRWRERAAKSGAS